MLFNSLLFLFLFLPLAWGGFRLCSRMGPRFAAGWLVAVSLFFYGWWTPAYLLLLCGSIVFNYTVGFMIQRTVEKPSLQQAILALGVTANLLLLGYYKYLFPVLHWVEQYGIQLVPPGTAVLLPLGISFFTFTQIGYLIDCQAALTASRSFIHYALFVTFFPHLIAGPILHHREMLPQFENKEIWRFKLDNIAIGLSIFFIGLAKKDVVADYFASYANIGFSNPGGLTFLQAWFSAFAYSMQLYFDFSGYSEMAIGLGLLFNIRFPANFDSPYKSRSIIDFWQRWHMTLTRYLNLYLYNPIALWITRRRAERHLPVGRQGLRTFSGYLAMAAVPTFVTMIPIGIWHGAGLQFVVFGLLHGVYLSVNHAWRILFHKRNAPEPVGLPLWLSTVWKVALTYLAVLVAQVFFRSPSVPGAIRMLTSMAGQQHLPPDPYLFSIGKKLVLEVVLAFLFVWLAPNVLQIFAAWEPTLSKPHALVSARLQWKPNVAWAVGIGVLATLAILAVSGQTEFLYFRF
jgi:alginate O-acetyltransferase complex protein AlgI